MIGDWDWDWGNHLGTPVWGVLAACAVLGFDGHQLGDLAGDDGFGRKGRDLIRVCSGRRVALDLLLQCTSLIS